jgi:hypothetical protein
MAALIFAAKQSDEKQAPTAPFSCCSFERLALELHVS